MNNLTKKKCIPCEDKSLKPFTKAQVKEYSILIPQWNVASNSKSISRTVLFKDFVSLLKKVNEIGKLAEKEGHHPNMSIVYNKLDLVVYTHSIKGLSENDFILAAKINALLAKK